MFEGFVQHLLPINAPRSVITILDGLVLFIQALGLANDTAWLRSAQQRLRSEVRDTRNKAQRLRHALALLELGVALMQGAPLAGTRLSHAVRYRDGLIIALLAMRPLRARNFLGLILGRHLVRQDGRWWILIAASETKNRRPVEVPFPARLVDFLEHYLAAVRPMLARRHGAAAGGGGPTLAGQEWRRAVGAPSPRLRLRTDRRRRSADPSIRICFVTPWPPASHWMTRSTSGRPRRCWAMPRSRRPNGTTGCRAAPTPRGCSTT